MQTGHIPADGLPIFFSLSLLLLLILPLHFFLVAV